MSWDTLSALFPNATPSELALIREEAQDVMPRNSDGSPQEGHFQAYFYGFLRLLHPANVIETGIHGTPDPTVPPSQHGLSTKFILAAFKRNAFGILYSCDPIYEDKKKPDICQAIDLPLETSEHWRVSSQSSYAALPCFASDVIPWHVFLHDSDHGVGCQTFEYEFAWHFVKPGGWIASDDWTWAGHGAWQNFCRRHELEFTTLGHAALIQKPKDSVVWAEKDIPKVLFYCVELAKKAETALERWKR